MAIDPAAASTTVVELADAEVAELATLARLALSAAERAGIAAELGSILVHMQALAEVATDGIEPMTHVGVAAAEPALRADVTAPSFPSTIALGSAPRRAGEYFVVPVSIAGATEDEQ